MSDAPLLAEASFLSCCDMPQPETLRLHCGQVAVFTARCPGKKSPNEDGAVVIPCGEAAAVIAVADGVGGESAGEVAAGLALGAIQDEVVGVAGDPTLLRSAIMTGFDRANEMILQLGIGAATTLAVVEIQNGAMRPYHVGDSVILLIGGRGKVKLESVAHSPVGYAVEAGMLDKAEAMHHEDRHLVSNVIGRPDMRIEVGSMFPLAPRDTLLLASDGLADNLHVEEIVARVRKGRLAKALERLAVDARERMSHPAAGVPSKPDDLTVVAFRCNSKSHSRDQSRGNLP